MDPFLIGKFLISLSSAMFLRSLEITGICAITSSRQLTDSPIIISKKTHVTLFESQRYQCNGEVR